mmetsp:Transcript_22480/g.29172  ORF Transcript_22480/g.29172 Transcript_22480/m.29172 type:complete len:637 (+) Transcript_22480:79-1989(+)
MGAVQKTNMLGKKSKKKIIVDIENNAQDNGNESGVSKTEIKTVFDLDRTKTAPTLSRTFSTRSNHPGFRRPTLDAIQGTKFATSFAKLATRNSYCKTSAEEMIWDGNQSIDVEFKQNIFWREFFFHILLPFSVLLIYWRGGKLSLKNRDLWSLDSDYSNLLVFLGTYVMTTMFYLLILLSILFRETIFHEENMQANILWSIYLMALRSAAIALKHAYRSNEDIKDLDFKVFSSGYKRCDELLFGWLKFDNKAVFRYIKEVEQVVPHDQNRPVVLRGGSKDHLPMLFPYASKHFPSWEKQLLPHIDHSSSNEQEILVPMGMITLELLLRESEEHPNLLTKICTIMFRLFVALCHIGVILLVRAEMNVAVMGETYVGILIQIMFLLITFMICFMFFAPIGIAVAVHFRRQFEWSSAVCLLLKDKTQRSVQVGELGKLRIEEHLSLPLIGIRHNILTWLLLRRIVRSTGLKFHKRTNGILSGMLLFLIILSICFVWWFLNSNFDCDSCFQIQLLCLFGLQCFFFFTILAIAVYHGTKANQIPTQELALLNSHKLQLISILCESSNVDRAALSEEVILESTLLDQAIQSVITDGHSESLYLLGAKMNTGILLAICSILLTGILAVLDLTAFARRNVSSWC